jgi:hypothetical protein
VSHAVTVASLIASFRSSPSPLVTGAGLCGPIPHFIIVK